MPAAVLVSTGCSVARKAGAAALQRPHDVLKICDRARKPINARDHQHVAFADEIENSGQFGAPLRRGAARLLLADHVAPSRLERLDLERVGDVRIHGEDWRVSGR